MWVQVPPSVPKTRAYCSCFLLCATIDVAQVKPRAMHVSTEKAIALREKPPFDNIKTIILSIVIYQKEVL